MSDVVYDLISADSHVIEPGDIFEKRLPRSLRDRAPKFESWNGGNAWRIEGIEPVPFLASTVTGSGYRKARRGDDKTAVAFNEVMPALYDPVERIMWRNAADLYKLPYEDPAAVTVAA